MNVGQERSEPAMLAAAMAAAQESGVAVDFRAGGSGDLRPGMGPFNLVAMGRSFHWMDRAATLAMLDRIVKPGGAVALFHDAHPPLEENRWFKTLYDVARKFGRDENAHVKERDGGHRRYEPYLFASAFTRIEGLTVTVRQPLDADAIVGRAFSTSVCARDALGERAAAFEAELRAALRELSPDGRFTEVAELVAVLARRPD